MTAGTAAASLAASWLAAWAAHDLDSLCALYAEDVRFCSPYLARHGTPAGVLQGRSALRDYLAGEWARYPDARPVQLGLLAGVAGCTLVYEIGGYVAAETMELARGRIARSTVHWGSVCGIGRAPGTG